MAAFWAGLRPNIIPIAVDATKAMMIEFIGANENPKASNDPKDLGWRHLCITVEDIDAGIQFLDEKEIKWIGEKKVSSSSGTKARFFLDPEENIVHLIERPNPL